MQGTIGVPATVRWRNRGLLVRVVASVKRAWCGSMGVGRGVLGATVAVCSSILVAGCGASGSRLMGPPATGSTSPSPAAGIAGSRLPAPPAGSTANEFAMAPAGVLVVGGVPLPRPTCTRRQIKATAVTRRTVGGVLGVVHLVGAVVKHDHGVAVRCALPLYRGPSTLVTAGGRRLAVPLSAGDATGQPSNPRPDLALNNGDAIWGFAWFGSYCGARANAVQMPLREPIQGLLRARLHGAQPRCDHRGRSVLIDGIAGQPRAPVQPARPDFSRLRLTGRISAGTTSRRLAPIDLTLRVTGSAPVVLDPCPFYAGRDYGIAHSGGFSDPLRSGHLPCVRHAVVVRLGHPLRWTVPGTSLVQTLGTGAIRGSRVHASVGIAGVAQLQLQTRVR